MQPQRSSGVYVIRNRLLITHLDPERREIVDEVSLLNDSKSNVADVFLARLKFMPALHILDNDGTELPYYPNDYTRQLIAEKLVNEDSSWRQILDRINSKELFVLWISFPPGKEIRPKESRRNTANPPGYAEANLCLEINLQHS